MLAIIMLLVKEYQYNTKDQQSEGCSDHHGQQEICPLGESVTIGVVAV